MLSKAVTASVFATLAVFVASAANAINPEDPLVTQIAKSPAIMVRVQRDPRIALHEEMIGKSARVHVYLTLSNLPQAYVFSLGWLTPQDTRTCVDEQEQEVPLPGEKPGKTSKVAQREVRGFDLISAGKERQALKEFEEAVHEPQGSPRYYSNLGACLALLGEPEKAQQQFALALKMQADYPLALVNKAWMELSNGRPDNALLDARKVLESDPELRSARFVAVKAMLGLKDIAGAVKMSEETFKRWPADPTAIIMSGDVLAAGGDYKTAAVRYKKALILLPNEPQILIKVAEAFQMQGKLDDALKRARQATAVGPNLPETHLALGRYLEMNREERAAEIQFERALDLNPPDSIKMAIYGPMLRVLIAQKKLDDADKLTRKWVSANDECAECHYNKAWIAAQLPGPQHQAEAIDEYRKAIVLNKDLVQAHYNVALLLVKEGKKSEAAKELKAFIRLAPQDPDIDNARKLLAQIGQ